MIVVASVLTSATILVDATVPVATSLTVDILVPVKSSVLGDLPTLVEVALMLVKTCAAETVLFLQGLEPVVVAIRVDAVEGTRTV